MKKLLVMMALMASTSVLANTHSIQCDNYGFYFSGTSKVELFEQNGETYVVEKVRSNDGTFKANVNHTIDKATVFAHEHVFIAYNCKVEEL